MSTTLTWNFSGLGTKSGTAVGNLIDDIVALVNSKSGDANYNWQVASSQNTGNTLHIVLKRKDASVGRVLLIIFTASPANQNSALFDQAPSLNTLYGAWFPNGNVDTPSNITAATGTVLGDDTGSVKSWASMLVSSIYGANVQVFTVDSTEGIYFFFQNPATSTMYGSGVGKLIVDGGDVERDCVVGFAANSLSTLGQGGQMIWTSAASPAGGGSACVRTNYGAANRVYFIAWAPNGAWLNTAVGSGDILSDTATQRAWFQSLSLIGQVKGEGIVLKLRQFGIGPGTTAAFTSYNITGPVVAARQCNALSSGGIGYPWFTNFKI